MRGSEMSGGMAVLNWTGAHRMEATGEIGGSKSVTGTGHGTPPISSFAAFLTNATDVGALSGAKTFGDLRERLLNGGLLAPRDLIALQIRAGEIGLSVEMVSKIADGILGAARRIQTPQ